MVSKHRLNQLFNEITENLNIKDQRKERIDFIEINKVKKVPLIKLSSSIKQYTFKSKTHVKMEEMITNVKRYNSQFKGSRIPYYETNFMT